MPPKQLVERDLARLRWMQRVVELSTNQRNKNEASLKSYQMRRVRASPNTHDLYETE